MRLDAIRSGVLVVGLALVLAGCVLSPESGTDLPASEPTPSVQPPNTAEPSPTSSELPSATPANTTAAEVEETAMESCYLFLVESGVKLGGQPVEQEVTYLGMDGIVQASREMSNDLILHLGEEELDTNMVFAALRQAEFPAPPKAPTPGPNTPVIVSEGSGPTLLIEAGDCGGHFSRWVGEPEKVPASLVPVVVEARALRSRVDWEDPVPGTVYVRALYLESGTDSGTGSGGRTKELSDQQVEANRPLALAMARVRRLVKLPEGIEQYVGIQGSLSQGARLYVTYEQIAYLVRHLVTGPE